MKQFPKPKRRPANPRFSSGPCAKPPGWSPERLAQAELGRSHRSKPAREKLAALIDGVREILQVPDSHRIGIVPASDTGAFEMAMWSLLGVRGVDLAFWESFGKGWAEDAKSHLRLEELRLFEAEYGEIPDLGALDFDRDVVFVWNGTTSGVRVPADFRIPAERKGLTLCDATSAAFAQPLPFERLDVTTLSWQKALGGEAAHGMLILGPRAVERLESEPPPRPLPKIFRLTKNGKLIEGIFRGDTINTPSMLAVEDFLFALDWARRIGGRDALFARADANAAIVNRFADSSEWLANCAAREEIRSNSSVCLKIVDADVLALDSGAQASFARAIAEALEAEGVAFDVASYRDAPPGLRIWTGATVEAEDLEALLPWLEWAFRSRKAERAEAA